MSSFRPDPNHPLVEDYFKKFPERGKYIRALDHSRPKAARALREDIHWDHYNNTYDRVLRNVADTIPGNLSSAPHPVVKEIADIAGYRHNPLSAKTRTAMVSDLVRRMGHVKAPASVFASANMNKHYTLLSAKLDRAVEFAQRPPEKEKRSVLGTAAKVAAGAGALYGGAALGRGLNRVVQHGGGWRGGGVDYAWARMRANPLGTTGRAFRYGMNKNNADIASKFRSYFPATPAAPGPMLALPEHSEAVAAMAKPRRFGKR